MTNDVLDIAYDEAGHTGPDLLSKQQRYFGFSSVAIGDAEARAIIQKARAEHPVQMPELKASKLLASSQGRRLVSAVLAACEGRYAVNLFDKLLALCGWLFEYIYEPVLQDDPRLLYEKNLHRFVAMYAYLWMLDPESDAPTAIEQFQKYMRSRDPVDAPFLFDNPRPPLSGNGTEHPFESVLRFAYGYRDIIIADNARLDQELPERGRWTLDLSSSALWSHLNHWGRKGKLLSVRCDASKPLKAMTGAFTGDENDPGVGLARRNGHKGPLGWKLAQPVAFVDSRNHPANQLADIIAGAAVAVVANDFPAELKDIAQSVARHLLPDTILPDMDIVNPKNRSALVNSVILYGLATRAEEHAYPYKNLPELYHAAEVAWVRGDLRILEDT